MMMKEKENTVLLVDDNPMNLQVLFQTLNDLDARFLIAKSGEAAMEIIKKSRPDLILLDINMPGIDGYEVCRRVKRGEALSRAGCLRRCCSCADLS